MSDVRDLAGRLQRLITAGLIGTASSIAIALALPRRHRFSGCMTSPDDIPVSLVIAGAVGLTLLLAAVLGALARRPPRIRMPRAIVAGRVR